MATTTKSRASKSRYQERTKEELDALARDRDVDGRSGMSKDELVVALELEDIGPDALTLLTRQHERIRELFESLSGRAPRPSQVKIDEVRELLSTLVKHAEIEELVFYPAVREVLSEDDLLDESLEEHHAAEVLLYELERTPAEAERYDAKITVLSELVLHHIEEEETELFPKVRDALDDERRRELGAAMQRAWKVAPSRPHPAAPDTPPGNWLMGLPAAGFDLFVGVLKAGKRQLLRR